MRKSICMFFLIITLPSLFLTCTNDKAEITQLTTNDPGNITASSAVSGGFIATDGGAAIQERGVCWWSGTLPTTEDNKTLDGKGTGNFSSIISGLTENTTYSIRAYATNSVGTGYGNKMAFKTPYNTVQQKGWIVKNSNSDEDLYSIYFPEPLTGYVVGNSGTILKTNDGGESWYTNSSGTSRLLRSVCFTDINTGFAVGDSGIILKTLNAGTNWTIQNSGISNRLFSVIFIDSNNGWIVGEKGLILKTSNGGTNWTTLNSISLNSLYSVIFTDSNTGFCIDRSQIFKTSDGGVTWVPNYQLSNMYSLFGMTSMFFTDSGHGYIVGGSPENMNSILLKTNDGGSTWEIKSVPKNLGLKVLIAYRSILKTTDGGSNWTTQITTSYSLMSVYFLDNNTGYSVGQRGVLLKTVNGGSN